ncbi:hypothetical protein G7046_g1433 [Stylonectria norvegica]|nr:hypothetical protein G7046_g1433 [Stylonectria norvegica]
MGKQRQKQKQKQKQLRVATGGLLQFGARHTSRAKAPKAQGGTSGASPGPGGVYPEAGEGGVGNGMDRTEMEAEAAAAESDAN